MKIAELPYMGTGLGYRRELKKQFLEHAEAIPCIEIITDQYLEASRHDELYQLGERFRHVVPHGVGLSIGTATDFDPGYLKKLRDICAIIKPTYYSEHICVTQVPGLDIGHLSPCFYSPKALRILIDKILFLEDFLGLPIVLENITMPFFLDGWDEQKRLFENLLEKTSIGFLLDLANLYINSRNFSRDWRDITGILPRDRVVQIHLAGGIHERNWLIDSHSEAVDEEVWTLLDEVAQTHEIRSVIIERDDNFPKDFSELLAEVTRAQTILTTGLKRCVE